MASHSNSRGLVLLLITSCFFITGILFDYMPMIIDDHIKRTVELATNEEIIGYWTRPPVDVNSYYWLYEIVNADQFHGAGAKPQVRQLGPFHFISRIEKRIVGLSANKFRLTYNATRFARLNESHSRDQLDRPVTLANPFYATILEGARLNANQFDGQTRAMLFGTLNKMTEKYNESVLERNTTARTALLGRPMPIITKLLKVAQTLGMASKLPDVSPSGKFGYVALTNDTLSGPFEIYTGYQETARSLGELISYKGKRRLNYYDGKCNRMQTSAGELRPMPIEAEKRLEMFQPTFCRIVHLDPNGQHKLREGLAVSYSLSQDDFASAASNPDNRCFCVNSTGPTSPAENDRLDDNHCSLDGVIDLGPCSYGAPLLVAPSNMQLDSRIINSLGPDFDPEMLLGEVSEIDLADDKSQIVILKRVGVPIRADITATVFLRLVRDPNFKETANLPDLSYLPLVTIRETITIPPKLGQILINLESFISMTYHIKVVMYLSAVMLLFWLSGHYYCLTSEADARQRPSGPAEPGAGAGSSAHAAQQRRQSRASTAMGGAPGNGSGNGPGGGGANGLQPVEDPAAAAEQPAEANMARRASSGQFKLNLATGGRRGDKLGGVAFGHRNSLPKGLPPMTGEPRVLDTVGETGAPAAAGDTTSSERANSADSNRSLPPSRHTSRLGSLSGTSAELEAGATADDSSPASPKQAPSETSGYATNGSAAKEASGRSGPERNNLRKSRKSRRIFSKVDEQLDAARKNRVGAAEAGRIEARGKQATIDEGDSANGAELGEQAADEAGQETGARALGQKRRRKNWFADVYSNLLHMLNGLRGPISAADDAGAAKAGDFRDRQLEMLAGKIDNWYSGQAGDGAGAAAGPQAEGQDPAGDSDSASRSIVSPATVAQRARPGPGGPESTLPVGEAAQTQTGTQTQARAQIQTQTQTDEETAETEADGGDQADGRAANRDEPPSDRMIANEPEPEKAADQLEEEPAPGDGAKEGVSLKRAEPGAPDESGEGSNPPPDSGRATPTAADVESSEPNLTERNGLDSRSMRVGSSREVEDGGYGGDEPEEGPEQALGETASGRHSSELAAAADDDDDGRRSAARPLEGSAGGEGAETETEPETETETETEAEARANKLDKATTLDRIAAALNGHDDEEMAAGQLAAHSESLDEPDAAAQPSGATADRQAASMINSSTSLESVIDLKMSAAPNGPAQTAQNKEQLAANQSTTVANEQPANDHDHGDETTNGRSPADKLLQLNGLAPASAERSTQTNTLPLQQANNGRAAKTLARAHSPSVRTRPDGAREKLVDDDDDYAETDETDRRQQEEPLEMRTENSSKSPVSNSLPRSSGEGRLASLERRGAERERASSEVTSNAAQAAANSVADRPGDSDDLAAGGIQSTESLMSGQIVGRNDALDLQGPNVASKLGLNGETYRGKRSNGRGLPNNRSTTFRHQQQHINRATEHATIFSEHNHHRPISTKLIVGNNLPGSAAADGNNILNGKIISHYQSQVAETKLGGLHRLTADQRRGRVRAANHKQTTASTHPHYHHQQRPVQPAGA